MDKQAIYRKTFKGQNEMTTRAFRLPARERSVLVLVDGKRNGAELIDRGVHFGDSEAFLDHLIEAGFIEPVAPPQKSNTPLASKSAASLASVQPPKTVSPQPPKPVPPVASKIRSQAPVLPSHSMAHTINFARHFLLEALGPEADALTVRIEASRSLPELALALEKSRDALQVIAGKRKAELFWQEIKARLPDGR
jgi:hypothetical protein